MGTSFSLIYDSFLSRITSDMYMELDELQTYSLLQELLVAAIPWFEFPRKDLNGYELLIDKFDDFYCGIDSNMLDVKVIIYDGGYFNVDLSNEEINILSCYMIVEWLGQQLASIENIRMKYSGSDFKFTSQANHLQKVLTLKKDYEREGFHLQRLYKRRKIDSNGFYKSTMGQIMGYN